MADFNIAVRYQFHTFPSCEKAVMADYPKRNFLSFLLAVNYVYPALKKFLSVRYVIKDQKVILCDMQK